MPIQSHRVLPLSEKVKSIDIVRKEKEFYAEVTKIKWISWVQHYSILLLISYAKVIMYVFK